MESNGDVERFGVKMMTGCDIRVETGTDVSAQFCQIPVEIDRQKG